MFDIACSTIGGNYIRRFDYHVAQGAELLVQREVCRSYVTHEWRDIVLGYKRIIAHQPFDLCRHGSILVTNQALG